MRGIILKDILSIGFALVFIFILIQVLQSLEYAHPPNIPGGWVQFHEEWREELRGRMDELSAQCTKESAHE